MNIAENPYLVTKPFLPPINEYKKEIEKIWETNWLTNSGPLHEKFNKEIKSYLNVKESTLFVNGHIALELAIKSFEFPKDSEIITTPFTFASTTHAIVNNGLTPVFCDIKLDDFTIDTDKIESLITEKTVAILPVHIFGYPVDVYKVKDIADKYNLKVIYDAAHSFGVKINNIDIGNFGDISMFSFHATKVFHSIEGGVLTYSNEKLKNRLDLYKNFGVSGLDSVELIGINGKMNEFQAAMGVVNLRYVDSEIDKRKNIINLYRKNLKNIIGVRFLEDRNGLKHNYAYFPIIVDELEFGLTRDLLYEELKKYNIFSRKYFYPLITDFECYKGFYNDSHLINAKYISDRVLTLPLYTQLNINDIVYISSAISEIKSSILSK
ncbi:DegT/DnrJ/EryC1/StrS family aminotransferase [bacterium]|nr:DegT/DnrJ/EryC1/StrS family aminotransferase [bacterium]